MRRPKTREEASLFFQAKPRTSPASDMGPFYFYIQYVVDLYLRPSVPLDEVLSVLTPFFPGHFQNIPLAHIFRINSSLESEVVDAGAERMKEWIVNCGWCIK
jgi:hypothetical protein